MPIHLIAPGKRKGNRFYLVRGQIGGRDIEVSTKTRDPEAAARFKVELERRALDARIPGAAEEITFAKAAELYRAWRDPSDADKKRIDRVVAHLGQMAVGAILQADLVDAAIKLHPAGAPATRNREVLRPAAAILHYAAEQRYCAWLRIKLFKEPRPRTRSVTIDTAATLLQATTGMQQLLLLWLFRQGNRISDALRVEWERIDLVGATVRMRIGKTDEWTTAPLHEDLVAALANIKEEERGQFVFPWRSRFSVYNWLRPLVQSLGLAFTPHMARHSLGTWLNAQGAGLKTIMAALGHADPKSSMRYQTADVEIVRQAGAKVGRLIKGRDNS
ncbi:MAG: integrase/recombinase family protein [Rhodospirillales bacterium]|nr:integrase/recombinase family protein [Rhodospirillales bacterium]